MRIIVTGAAGKIGQQIVEELSGSHELVLVDRRTVAGRSSTIADLARNPASNRWISLVVHPLRGWTATFQGADAVIHLAAHPRPIAPWRQVLRNNIRATWNVLEAAAHHKVPRVVYASSHWAVRALEQELAPGCYETTGSKIGSEAAPRPLTAYGISKGLGELAGRTFVDEGRLRSFVAVRIGNYRVSPSERYEQRVRWIGGTDIRSLFRRCVEAEFDGFHVVYGVSAQPEAPFDLSYTRRLLSWHPQQRS